MTERNDDSAETNTEESRRAVHEHFMVNGRRRTITVTVTGNTYSIAVNEPGGGGSGGGGGGDFTG
jgi:hypothetical protein